MEEKSLENIEFETKYRVEDQNLIIFKQLLDALPEEKKFFYVEGPDFYFTYPDWWFKNNPQWDPNGTFGRYRKPSYGLDNGRRQVTCKYKPRDARDSIQRTEYNTDIGNTPESTVFGQFQAHGMTLNASIIKNCHIYKLADATLVFYTVYDTTDGKPKKADNFVEIEVDEDTISTKTEGQAWAVIAKYEKILEPVGVNPQKRLRKSLFEMYKR
jgi:adenylate cyclase class IV